MDVIKSKLCLFQKPFPTKAAPPAQTHRDRCASVNFPILWCLIHGVLRGTDCCQPKVMLGVQSMLPARREQRRDWLEGSAVGGC